MQSVLARFASRQDYHQTVSYARVMEAIGWIRVPVGNAHLFIKQIGPVCFGKLQRANDIDFTLLSSLRRKLRCVLLYIDPGLSVPQYPDVFTTHGYKKTMNHHAHTKTLILDLAPSLDRIHAGFSQAARRGMRAAKASGVTYTTMQFKDIPSPMHGILHSLHRMWSTHKKIYGYEDRFIDAIVKQFPDSHLVYATDAQGKIVGALYLLIVDRVAIYFYTFTHPTVGNQHVTAGLIETSIKIAKDAGCDIYDFCSAYDDRFPNDNPRWKGFSEFKKRFHPTPVLYPDSFCTIGW